MLKENNGQIAVEYLFIFAIALIILTIFTLPLASLAIDKTTDVSDAVNVKSQMYKIAGGIRYMGKVMAQGRLLIWRWIKALMSISTKNISQSV